MQEKVGCSLVLATAPWAGQESVKEADWLLLGKENGQQATAPRPHIGPGREGKMQQSAEPQREECSREVQAAGTQISFSSEGKNVFLRDLGKSIQEI